MKKKIALFNFILEIVVTNFHTTLVSFPSRKIIVNDLSPDLDHC